MSGVGVPPYPRLVELNLNNRSVHAIAMFNLMRRAHLLRNIRASPTFKFHLLRKSILSSNASSVNQNSLSFRVSYLRKKCGFTLKSAVSASSYLFFDSPEKPDSVINFFKTHGFSDTQISRIFKRDPKILLRNSDNFLAKLEFFQSKGASMPDIAKISCKNFYIFGRSLEKFVIPNYGFLRNLLDSDEKTITVLRRSSILHHVQYPLEPNMNILRDVGVPQSNIVSTLLNRPMVFELNPDKFREVVEEIKEMGLDPLKSRFVVAVSTRLMFAKSTWERKLNSYERWGWTREETLTAFRIYPTFMSLSKDNVTATMDFLVNKMGWESCSIARYPPVLGMSLKKRIIPRAAVIQFLLSEGLLKKNPMLSNLFNHTEEIFLKKYVKCYKKAPRLSKIYEDNLSLSTS